MNNVSLFQKVLYLFSQNEFYMVHSLINIFERDTRASARAVSVKEEDIDTVYDIMPLFDEFTYDKVRDFTLLSSEL